MRARRHFFSCFCRLFVAPAVKESNEFGVDAAVGVGLLNIVFASRGTHAMIGVPQVIFWVNMLSIQL